MLDRIRDRGPVVLVPLAWLVVTGAQLEVVSAQSIFIAHLVMAVFIAGFVATGWSAMATGALAGWRAVMVVGLPVTLAGIGGFVTDSEPALIVSLVGWMVLPAAGLLYTAREFPAARSRYAGAGAITALGAVCYLAWLAGTDDSIALLGLGLVGLGQTIGIADAAIRS